ncbi:hypothetical protein [Pelosinus baikalensis]|uniref:Uncharacterized protein n=1 Tax=Pelosinus baikalensis TaxID=2892015 RepID=A0ABS8HU53_9FIRM|nr:hypothetical protein [Pelosinus baikalensis]MCC5465773.1 hypothetical protein [Pelosinus baikalensis]
MRRVLECFNPAAKDMSGTSVRNAEEINEYDHFILGHITSTAILDSISEKGLLPPRVTNIRIKDNLDSDIECVYLLCKMDKSYVRRAIEEFGGEGLVVLSRVAKHKLFADENVLWSVQKEDTLLKNERIKFCI